MIALSMNSSGSRRTAMLTVPRDTLTRKRRYRQSACSAMELWKDEWPSLGIYSRLISNLTRIQCDKEEHSLL